MRIFIFALALLTGVVAGNWARAGGYGYAQVTSANVLLAPAPACYVAPAATLQVYARTVTPVTFNIVPTVPAVPAPAIQVPAPMTYPVAAPVVQAVQVQQAYAYAYAAPAAVAVNVNHGYAAGLRSFSLNVGHGYGAAGNVFVQRNVVRARGLGRQVVVQRQVNVVRPQVVRQRTVAVGGQVLRQRTVVRPARGGLLGRVLGP